MTNLFSRFAPGRSLKARVTFVTLAIFVLSIWVLVFHISRLLRDDMQAMLAKQQFSTVSFMADEANRELNDRLQSLSRTAVLLGRDYDGRRESLRAFLEARSVLVDQFSGGIVVLDMRGEALAEAPSRLRLGQRYLAVDPVSATLKEGKSTIGRPQLDPLLGGPVFNMAVPIRDTDGVVIGALLGVTDLEKANFLDQITARYYGTTGYFLLADATTRRIVTDTDKKRVFQALPVPGVNPAIERFVEGYDETNIIEISDGAGRGTEVLASARRVPVADWFIVAALPTDEAFALIYQMQWSMLQGTLVLTLLAGALTWWLLSRQLSPMMDAVKTLASLSESDQPPQPLLVSRRDEIGRLIGGFNRLLKTLSQHETDLQNTLRFQEALMDAVPSPIFFKGNDGRYIGCNKAFESYLGRSRQEIVGKTVYDLAPLDLAEKYDQADQALFAKPGVQTYEASVVYADGTRHEVVFNKATFLNVEGKLAGQVGVILDITERKQMERQMRRQALHDTLTQLANRRLLNDRLTQTLAVNKRSGRYCALMFIDLDNFKPLNDQHGHEVGDLLLIAVAARLKGTVREMDTVARFGGDEFVVILSDLGANVPSATELAMRVAEKIRVVLGKPYRLVVKHQGQPETTVEHRSTASIGLVVCSDHSASQEDVLKWADIAMYQAKESGRNAVRLYDPSSPTG